MDMYMHFNFMYVELLPVCLKQLFVLDVLEVADFTL